MDGSNRQEYYSGQIFNSITGLCVNYTSGVVYWLEKEDHRAPNTILKTVTNPNLYESENELYFPQIFHDKFFLHDRTANRLVYSKDWFANSGSTFGFNIDTEVSWFASMDNYGTASLKWRILGIDSSFWMEKEVYFVRFSHFCHIF